MCHKAVQKLVWGCSWQKEARVKGWRLHGRCFMDPHNRWVHTKTMLEPLTITHLVLASCSSMA